MANQLVKDLIVISHKLKFIILTLSKQTGSTRKLLFKNVTVYIVENGIH